MTVKSKLSPRRLGDLQGKRPQGHPELRRSPRGKISLDLGQVWVELHTQDLYVIRGLSLRSDGKKHNVSLSRYGRNEPERSLSETSLRQTMRVWEDAVELFAQCMKKVCKAIEDGEGKPFGMTNVDDAAEFFGVGSKNGQRTSS